MANVWVGDSEDEMRRARPKGAQGLEIPRGMRRAEVVCSARRGAAPSLIAIVYPNDVTLDRMRVEASSASGALGEDLAVPCRCGETHAIDGGKLRQEVMGSGGTRGRAPRIDVRSLTT